MVYAIPDPTTPAGGDGREVLRSPPPRPDNPALDLECDAAHGPVPLACNVVARHGAKTFVVDFAVETYLNDCAKFSGSTRSPLLSNQYRLHRVTDQDSFSKLVYEGEAVFDAGLLKHLNAVPDDYIGYLGIPVADNMQRVDVQTTPSPDGSRVAYRVVDQEKPFNLLVRSYNVSRIEAYHTTGYEWIGGEGVARKGIEYFDALNPFRNTVEQRVAAYNVPILGWFSQARDAYDFSDAIVPHVKGGVVIRVWGNRNATRASLLTVAQTVATRALDMNLVYWSQQEAQVTFDLMGKFVEYRLMMRAGPAASALVLGKSAISSWFGSKTLSPETIEGVTTSQPADNPAPPNSKKMRGTFASRLVSQALSSTVCDTPGGGPALVEKFQTRTP